MKQSIIILFLYTVLGLGEALFGQTTTQNYIVSTMPNQAIIDPTTLTSANSNSTIQYFDGLGRSLETVQKAIAPTGKDLLTFTEYDAMGRDYKHWLPVPATGSTGEFVPATDFTGLANTQYTSSEKPYATTEYESSPLNRVLGQYGVGNTWYAATKKVKTDYQTNGANEVAYFYINSSNQLQRDASDYAANTLYKTKVTDEDGHLTTEYKDKLGRVVMQQSRLTASSNANTYYVYNDLGQLSYVLPPLAADALTAGVIPDNTPALVQYAFLYKYDERGNNIEKRLPGCDPIYMVYDKANRLVLSQDGNQRAKTTKQWTIIRYDIFSRVVYTGIINRDITSIEKDSVHNGVTTESYVGSSGFKSMGYSWSPGFTLSESNFIPLIVNYYDNYLFTSITTNGSNLNWVTPPAGYDAQYSSASGLLTGKRIYILDNVGTNYLVNCFYYDHRGQVVQSRSSNHLGGYDYSYNHYDFAGKVRNTYKVHNIAAQSDVLETYTYDYDNAGRPTTTTYKIFNEQIVLSNNKYDELGRLQTTYRHGGADTISYAYNIRNWTTMIKNGTFAEYLNYHDILHMGITACYNGNISCATYNYNGTYRSYDYSYDALNRLSSAVSVPMTSGFPTSSSNREEFTYDKQGNIKTLKRQNGTTYVDNLTMTYSGNQIKSITDANGSQGLYNVKEYQNKTNTTNEMSYDKNGNMTKDLDRDIVTIRYNVLNLPDTIQFKYGNQIINRYAADGRKLYTDYFTKLVQLSTPIDTGAVYSWVFDRSLYSVNSTYYVENMEYSGFIKTNGTRTRSLQRVHNSEGYSNNFNNSYMSTNFYYFRRDHLGNTREVWQAPCIVYAQGNTISPASVVQRTQYYPSGLPWSEGLVPGYQPYKYNGKEFVEMNGLDEYDSEARSYYPAIMRTTTIDPLAEKYYSISPYAWCANNPANMIDPDGQDCIITVQRDNNGQIIGITISATIFIKGEGASDKRANELDQLAKETFKSDKSNGVVISFDIDYVYDPNVSIEDVGANGKNMLDFTDEEVDRNKDRDSNVKREINGDAWYHGEIFNSKGKSISNYDVMHETMHFMGFDDRYNSTTNVPDKGYGKDIMGSSGAFDISPNHYANMYKYVMKLPEIQQDQYLKQIYNWLPYAAYRSLYRNRIISDKQIDYR